MLSMNEFRKAVERFEYVMSKVRRQQVLFGEEARAEQQRINELSVKEAAERLKVELGQEISDKINWQGYI